MAIEIRTELVTPEKAAGYLKKNVDNYRKISRAKVGLYAEEMKAGKWQLNGEGIMFDEAGKLKNGQHRLAAVILAGIPVQMTIITGVAEDVTIYDNGMMRSTKQMAQASGFGDITSTEAAAATAIVGRLDKVSRGRVLDWIGKHYGELNRAYRLCGANSKKSLSGRMTCVLASYMMLQVADMKSFELETFFRIFNSGNVVGTDGYEPSSALVARRMFEKYKQMPGNKRVFIEQLEVLVSAMKDFQKGKTRQMNYQLREPLAGMEMLDRLRAADGLTEGV